ncbi:MAG: DUF5615 family PIN-like protein [Anaerolineae bacterium]|nr:DUF5615 family PIN-like protein [Anaerolineae bacterium]
MIENQFKILTDEHIAKAIVQQLRKNGVIVDRVEDTVGKGTPDPDLIEYAHQNNYCLLTHDEHIVSHVKNRANAGFQHSGVFIAGDHLKKPEGIGRIVSEIIFWHSAMLEGAASIQNDVYNQVNYIK